MLVEGINVYKLLIIVFNTGSNQLRLFGGLAYGIPGIIVGATGFIGFIKHDHPYGGIEV